jgi:hypothetical protein
MTISKITQLLLLDPQDLRWSQQDFYLHEFQALVSKEDLHRLLAWTTTTTHSSTENTAGAYSHCKTSQPVSCNWYRSSDCTHMLSADTSHAQTVCHRVVARNSGGKISLIPPEITWTSKKRLCDLGDGRVMKINKEKPNW